MFPLGRYKFIESDYQIPITTIAVDGSEFNSNKIPLGLARYGSLTFYVKGDHASCSKDVIFKFVSHDSLRDQWDTEPFLEVSITANGDSVVQKSISINPDFEKIKLLSVQNQETVAGYTVDVNVSIFLK